MTRKEAIDMVKHILEMMPKEPPTECDYVEEWFYEDNEIRKALDMAIKALERELNTWSLDDAREDFMHDVYNTLDFLPTNEEANRIIDSFDRVTSSIEQKPRKGHWEVVSDGYSDNAYICECSECKDTVWVYKDADRKWNYCPNCGAKMRKVR